MVIDVGEGEFAVVALPETNEKLWETSLVFIANVKITANGMIRTTNFVREFASDVFFLVLGLSPSAIVFVVEVGIVGRSVFLPLLFLLLLLYLLMLLSFVLIDVKNGCCSL